MADAGDKQFIINHMNADHQNSLSLYLQAYNRVSASAAKSAQLEDLTLSDLVITTTDNDNSRTRYTVPFDPPLSSLSETRPRVVAMYHDSLARLGLSDITVKEYHLPRSPFHVLIFGGCLAVYVFFSRRANFVPGSVFYEVLGLAHVPGFAAFCHRIQPVLISTMVGMHIVETVGLAVLKLRPHRVPVGSGVWWKWVFSTFIEGFAAFHRFGGVVREERAKKEYRE